MGKREELVELLRAVESVDWWTLRDRFDRADVAGWYLVVGRLIRFLQDNEGLISFGDPEVLGPVRTNHPHVGQEGD